MDIDPDKQKYTHTHKYCNVTSEFILHFRKVSIVKMCFENNDVDFALYLLLECMIKLS